LNIQEYNTAVKTHSDGIYRFLLRFCDGETAKDIVQDSFEKLWIKRELVEGNKAKSYLFTTAYHTMVDKKRKDKRLDFTETLPATSANFTLGNPDIQEVLHKALNTLPEIQKTLVLLRDYEGYSYEEIGEITNLNPSQVKVYIFRARVTLKNHIGTLENVLG